MKASNQEITISALGEQKAFVSGNQYWFIEWAKFNGITFKEGTRVKWYDTDDHKWVKGTIEWLIIVDDGSVEVSINHNAVGRLPLDELEPVKS